MNTPNVYSLGLVVVAALVFAGCASQPSSPAVRANLEARSGSNVSGYATFESIDGRVQVVAEVSGLTPGEHGFHIHEVGDCSAPDGMSAKGHFNPGGNPHGHHAAPERHAGDMPNLVADTNGNARLRTELSGVSMKGPDSIVGRAVIVHADPDDYRSQPAGNAGKRVACGVIAAR